MKYTLLSGSSSSTMGFFMGTGVDEYAKLLLFVLLTTITVTAMWSLLWSSVNLRAVFGGVVSYHPFSCREEAVDYFSVKVLSGFGGIVVVWVFYVITAAINPSLWVASVLLTR